MKPCARITLINPGVMFSEEMLVCDNFFVRSFDDCNEFDDGDEKEDRTIRKVS